MKLLMTSLLGLAIATNASAADYLVKLKNPQSAKNLLNTFQAKNTQLVTDQWLRIEFKDNKSAESALAALSNMPSVEYVQPNYKISINKTFETNNVAIGMMLNKIANNGDIDLESTPTDNPEIPSAPTQAGSGNDPLFKSQWGMADIGVKEAWKKAEAHIDQDIVVAVIDTGVDYTHEDLIYNMWRNKNEIPGNGIDDDNNGYIDDIVGWDFASNDNKPYDMWTPPMQLLLGGGNPGHGTHCAGNVAARANNGKGIVGVAPNVKIMALRFLTEKGQGTTAGAIQAIRYAVDNGAHVLSNSWGSEGEDANSPDSKALKEAVQYAQDHGRLFVAAAGNGHQGAGYDNDTDSRPGFPASYDHEIIVSVAALDENDQLGSFSNWGKNSVDLGAPGVKVFSTVPDTSINYADTVFDMFGMTIHWDGTSMATPHVAGAAALYLSKHPNADWTEVKQALLDSTTPINSLNNKSTSNGKLNVDALLEY